MVFLHQVLGQEIRNAFAEHGRKEWQTQIELSRPGGLPRILLLRGTQLPEGTAGGFVVVFDDVTPERLTHPWVLRRAYRVGISTVVTRTVVHGGLAVRLRGLAGGAARVVVGGARWLLGWVTRAPRHAAWMHAAELGTAAQG